MRVVEWTTDNKEICLCDVFSYTFFFFTDHSVKETHTTRPLITDTILVPFPVVVQIRGEKATVNRNRRNRITPNLLKSDKTNVAGMDWTIVGCTYFFWSLREGETHTSRPLMLLLLPPSRTALNGTCKGGATFWYDHSPFFLFFFFTDHSVKENR